MSTMAFASLPMYDLAPLADAWDGLWAAMRQALAAQGIDAAEQLDRSEPHQARWRDPNLVLGYTCGWPYVSELRDSVVPIARFDFGLKTRRPGDYHSVFIGPAGRVPAPLRDVRDLAGLLADRTVRIAVNNFRSQSGWRVFGECVESAGKLDFDRIVLTGSHLGSIRAVAAGQADLAAIDAATWQFACDHEPATKAAEVIARSADAPGLPLITARNFENQSGVVYQALETAVRELPQATRRDLKLRGVVPARDADYDILLQPPFGQLAAA